MKTLHLNLKRKWFDMIISGEKKEEYREIKPFWLHNLVSFYKKKQPFRWWSDSKLALAIGDNIEYHLLKNKDIDLMNFDTITFSNGYKKDRPQFEIELKNIKIYTGKTEWGAIENEKYFVLELGNIIRRENIK